MKTTKVKCHKCGHIWNTMAKGKMVTCPSCQRKTRVIVYDPTEDLRLEKLKHDAWVESKEVERDE